MAYTLSNVHRDEGSDEESQGGLIGLSIPGKDGKMKKVWWGEDDFVRMFENGDEKTKEILLEAMKGGKGMTPEEDHKAAMWRWEDRGRKGEKPLMPEPASKDIPAKPEPIPAKPPFEESDFQAEDQAREVAAPRSGVKEPSEKSTMTPEMERLKTLSPYSTEGQERRGQGVPVTPENHGEWELEQIRRYDEYEDKKYGWLDRITASQAALQTNERMAENRWDEFFQTEGFPNMSIEYEKEYRRDPEKKELMHKYDQYKLRNNEKTLETTKIKFQDAQRKRDHETRQFRAGIKQKRLEVNEVIEQQNERNDPKLREKNMIELAKAKQDLIDSDSEDMQKALEFKIKRLQSELGIKEEAKETSGSKDEVDEYLEKEGLSEEDKERYRKEYNRRLKLARGK